MWVLDGLDGCLLSSIVAFRGEHRILGAHRTLPPAPANRMVDYILMEQQLDHTCTHRPTHTTPSPAPFPINRLVNDILTEQQLDRYSAFRRSSLRKPIQASAAQCSCLGWLTRGRLAEAPAAPAAAAAGGIQPAPRPSCSQHACHPHNPLSPHTTNVFSC